MKDLPGPRAFLPETVSPGDFPLGSAESRAAARAMAERFPRSPTIVTIYVNSAAECMNPGEIRFGTFGTVEVLERADEETEEVSLSAFAAPGQPAAMLLHCTARVVIREPRKRMQRTDCARSATEVFR
jgi:hypothetical protein